jgi:hypothetical protein
MSLALARMKIGVCPRFTYSLVINNDEKIRHYDKNLIGIPFGSKIPENDSRRPLCGLSPN